MELLRIGEFAELSHLSLKALRLYDELGLLAPARVDRDSGYRWYTRGQLDRARLVMRLRRLGMPLARIAAIVDTPAAEAANQLDAYWAQVETDHAARRDLVGYLVDRLRGTESVMFEVTVRSMPARFLLSAQRHATLDELGEWTTELVLRLGDGSVPGLPGIEGAPFCVYYGEVSDDGDGPVEWCRPVPDERATELAARFPDLTLRREPERQEAYVRLTRAQLDASWAPVVLESLERWSTEHGREPASAPRQIFIADLRMAGPDDQVCDLAVPLR